MTFGLDVTNNWLFYCDSWTCSVLVSLGGFNCHTSLDIELWFLWKSCISEVLRRSQIGICCAVLMELDAVPKVKVLSSSNSPARCGNNCWLSLVTPLDRNGTICTVGLCVASPLWWSASVLSEFFPSGSSVALCQSMFLLYINLQLWNSGRSFQTLVWFSFRKWKSDVEGLVKLMGGQLPLGRIQRIP